MSQYLDGHRVLKKGCNGENPCTNISQASLGCKARSRAEEKSLPAYPTFAITGCVPFLNQHLVRIILFMLIDFLCSLTRNLPFVTKPHVQDTSPTSRDATTVDVVETFSVTCIPYT
jgi:hypothetical protein